MEGLRRRMPVDPGQRGRRASRRAGDKMLDQLTLDIWLQPAPPSRLKHLSQIVFPNFLGQPQIIYNKLSLNESSYEFMIAN